MLMLINKRLKVFTPEQVQSVVWYQHSDNKYYVRFHYDNNFYRINKRQYQKLVKLRLSGISHSMGFAQ